MVSRHHGNDPPPKSEKLPSSTIYKIDYIRSTAPCAYAQSWPCKIPNNRSSPSPYQTASLNLHAALITESVNSACLQNAFNAKKVLRTSACLGTLDRKLNHRDRAETLREHAEGQKGKLGDNLETADPKKLKVKNCFVSRSLHATY